MPYIGKDPQFIYTYNSGTATGDGSTTTLLFHQVEQSMTY
jgi:hypothetical protein